MLIIQHAQAPEAAGRTCLRSVYHTFCVCGPAPKPQKPQKPQKPMAAKAAPKAKERGRVRRQEGSSVAFGSLLGPAPGQSLADWGVDMEMSGYQWRDGGWEKQDWLREMDSNDNYY